MLDTYARPLVNPLVGKIADKFMASNVGATQVTLLGFVIGLTGLFAVGFGAFLFGLVLILISRFLDGVDGVIARATQITQRGAFLDDATRWIIYAGFVFFISLAVPGQALGATFLLFTYLVLYIVTQGPPAQEPKPFYALSRLVEGTEITIFMVLCCLFPDAFGAIATLFGILCLITALARAGDVVKMLR